MNLLCERCAEKLRYKNEDLVCSGHGICRVCGTALAGKRAFPEIPRPQGDRSEK